MAGIFYGIGVGPGDPELMTLKAVRRIRECRVIAIPQGDKNACTAYKIARQAVTGLDRKACLALPMPMTRDEKLLKESHDRAAETVMEQLRAGENVAFLTLGDVTVYSTCGYLLSRLWNAGFETRLECGVPSFCAAAARLGQPLVSGAEELHLIPAAYQVKEALKLSGVKVFMKAGKQMKSVKEEIGACGKEAVMVENCGMERERIFASLKEIPDEAGYYSLLIVR